MISVTSIELDYLIDNDKLIDSILRPQRFRKIRKNRRDQRYGLNVQKHITHDRSEFIMTRSRVSFAFPILASLLVALALPVAAAEDTLQLLKAMARHCERIKDYTAVFQKQEVVKGKLLPQENILLKFRKPFSVYMRWLEGPYEGREVLYVRNKYKGKLIGHEGGFFRFLTLSLDPKGRRAMKGNRYPITEAGLAKVITRVLKDVEKGEAEGVLQLRHKQSVEVFGRRSRMITIRLPDDPERGFSTSKINLWIDLENGLPIQAEFFDWDLKKVGSYGYKELMLNVGLTENDFDRNNRSYRF